ncbi:hypothetical protein ACQP2Y_27585 [Actinoplanes sp. CA-051413]|uniref:hypothetical protein n=1 Tax=Actinoplanes sp. CA-051413 TaxID=3239899 RepID=UPI003D9603D1
MPSRGRLRVFGALLIVVGTATLSTLIAIAVNAATAKAGWPWPLHLIEEDPWHWVVAFAALTAVFSVLAWKNLDQGNDRQSTDVSTSAVSGGSTGPVANLGQAFTGPITGNVYVTNEMPGTRSAAVVERPPIEAKRIVSGLPEFISATLCDRRDEFEAVVEALADPEATFVTLQGDDGVGKTAIAADIAQNAPTDVAVSYLDARGYPGVTADSILESLVGTIANSEIRRRVRERLNGPSGDFLMKWNDVAAELAGQRVWLVLDDAQELLRPDGGGFRDQMLHNLLMRIENVPRREIKVLLVTNAPMPIDEREPVRIVEGLPEDFFDEFLTDLAAVGLARSSDVSSADLCRATRGNPRITELLLGTWKASPSFRFRDVVRAAGSPERFVRTLLGSLDRPQQRVMQVLAALDHPVSSPVVGHLTDATSGDADAVLEDLANYRVVRRRRHRYYIPTGEAARIRGAIAVDELRTLQRHAARFFEEENAHRTPTNLADLEEAFLAVDLYVTSGRPVDALRVILALEEECLMDWGQVHTLEPWLDQLTEELYGLGDQVRLASMRARAYAEQGRLHEAITMVHLAGRINEGVRSTKNKIMLRLQLGAYHFRAGEVRSAAVQYKTIVDSVAEKLPEMTADAHLGLALCLTETGHFDVATTHLDMAESPMEDRREVRIMLQRAIISLEQGDDRVALDQLGRARRAAGEQDRISAARCDELEAWVWLYREDADRALHLAERAFGVASRLGDPSLLGPSGATLAIIQLRRHESAKALAAASVAARYSVGVYAAETSAIKGLAALHQPHSGESAVQLFEHSARLAEDLEGTAPGSYLAYEAHGLALGGLALLGKEHGEELALEQFRLAVDSVNLPGARHRRRELFLILTEGQPRDVLPELRRLLASS